VTSTGPHVPPESEPGPKRPESILDALVSALAEAGPSAAEHVVTAGIELRRAAETVLTAITGALREHGSGEETKPGTERPGAEQG
jgi:hypothetical protein